LHIGIDAAAGFLQQFPSRGLLPGFVQIDECQQTTEAGIYSAGEPTGIGGVELALLEGQIAGHTAAGNADSAKALFPARARYREFVRAMKETFRLRPELAVLATDDILLCRCEDVTVGNARKHDSWKSAKLHTRCGMGPCQGRVCGAAAAFLFGWNIESQRPPVFPARHGLRRQSAASTAFSNTPSGVEAVQAFQKRRGALLPAAVQNSLCLRVFASLR